MVGNCISRAIPTRLPVTGTLETLPAITADDLKTYVRKIFAKNTLKIGIVGNVNAKEAGDIVDRIFGGLPAKANLAGVPEVEPQIGNGKVNVDIDVPQIRCHRRWRRHSAQGSGFHHGLRAQSHSRRRFVLLAALSRGARGSRSCLLGLLDVAAA